MMTKLNILRHSEEFFLLVLLMKNKKILIDDFSIKIIPSLRRGTEGELDIFFQNFFINFLFNLRKVEISSKFHNLQKDLLLKSTLPAPNEP